MAVPMHPISPVAHVPVALGVVRTLHIAARLETFCPPHPAPVLAGGRGVAALLLALLDGPQARSQVGARLEERGRCPVLQPGLTRPVLQPGLTRPALHADCLGQRLDGLLAVPLSRGCGASARQALAGEALATPWRPQETTTLTRAGA